LILAVEEPASHTYENQVDYLIKRICKIKPWRQRKWNWLTTESGVRNARQVTAYAYVDGLAFFQTG